MEGLPRGLNADNALEQLQALPCNYCGIEGAFALFREPNNNGIGIRCRACGRNHPVGGVKWLAQGKPQRSNDIRAVMDERGHYCWICGTDYDALRSAGIGMHVHHTQPFARHGDQVEKIPVCALCHELASAVQRHHRRLLGEKSRT